MGIGEVTRNENLAMADKERTNSRLIPWLLSMLWRGERGEVEIRNWKGASGIVRVGGLKQVKQKN